MKFRARFNARYADIQLNCQDFDIEVIAPNEHLAVMSLHKKYSWIHSLALTSIPEENNEVK